MRYYLAAHRRVVNVLTMKTHAYPFFSFPLVTIENAYVATAHAPNHVTREYGPLIA